MTDIVNRLRGCGSEGCNPFAVAIEAADEIERLREALLEAADELDSYYKQEWGLDHPIHQRNLKFAMESNIARATLEESK